MSVRVKICGLTTAETLSCTASAGAAYVGFNFFPKSPRYLTIEAATSLASHAPMGLCKAALTVDASDQELEAILASVPIDMLQLHGQESVDRVAEVKHKFRLPVMKAVGVSDAADLADLDAYATVADQLLCDAKPPKSSTLPGGNGLSFDWRLIANRRWTVPWMLAGGLTPENVAEAIELTGATQVDVSSGVESAPGQKDNAKIAAFITAATEGP